MPQLYSLQLVPRPGFLRIPERDPLPRGALVLTDNADIAAELSEPAERRTVLVPPEAATWDEDAMARLVAAGDQIRAHIRIVTSVRAAAWPAAPDPRLLALQEAAFLAAKQLAYLNVPDSSLAVLVLDPMREGTPHPHGALLTGLVKAMAWELPRTRVHAVVTDEVKLPAALQQLRRESGCVRGLPVAYYLGQSSTGTRMEERLLPVPETGLGQEDVTSLEWPLEGPVVVAVGGARGITARCIEGMRTPPSVVWLLGSTKQRTMTERAREIGDSSCAEYVRKRRAEDPYVHIAELRRTYDRCRKAQEALSNIAAMRLRSGPTRVHYLGCDITDDAAVRHAAATIRRTTPEVDLLVNGAGISGARRLAAKDLETFRRVRNTKVTGYHNLKSAFTDPAPRLWCNFSSVAGAFGLPGESDYGPANDVLNAAARYETALSRKSERSISWSLWGESGLGPRSGFTEYTERTGQLGLLSNDEGQRLFNAELESVHPGRAAVSTPLGDAELEMLHSQFPDLMDASDRRPYLGVPARVDAHGAVWKLDLAGHTHLGGHVHRSRAILPGALALELAVEAAEYFTGAAPVRTIQNVRFHAPIALHPQMVDYWLTASFASTGYDCGVVRVSIGSRLRLGNSNRHLQHFEALVPIGALAPSTQADEKHVTAVLERGPVPASLSGIFDQLRDVRPTPHSTTARWELRLPRGDDGEFFTSHRIPWLLADALLQAACVTARPNRYATPCSIRELRLHTTATDLELSEPAMNNIQLRAEHKDGLVHATATEPDTHRTLLTITDLEVRGRSAANTSLPSPRKPAREPIAAHGPDHKKPR
ncbi:SDR family NAD(P)-dependent oxidoreductase [Saccharopolyspora sp. ASAGF58]|uniref:SDR family NAD(P)-dependent oxidoreductase n=1 Tax=Saccharopolyspora sp. ASAGF58 TaxID=2719023 RepID=UPI001FF0A8EF|nr:SDR family NAD(P)-dependent oxidoreductase [Saccharopolyspora sp. ASAGF58]